MKKIFLSSILAGSFLIAPQVQAQGTLSVLKPTSGWNLTTPGGATPYCALSRSYDEDIILILGRNQSQEYSLAFDFQKSRLDTEKAYPVTLQPSPGQIRAYELMPPSTNAMVVRLGLDGGFFKAMKGSGVLKTEIDNSSYEFELADIENGIQQLDNCLGKIKGEAPQIAEFKAEKDDIVEVAAKDEPAEPIDLIRGQDQGEEEVQAIAEEAAPSIKIERVGQKTVPAVERTEAEPLRRIRDEAPANVAVQEKVEVEEDSAALEQEKSAPPQEELEALQAPTEIEPPQMVASQVRRDEIARSSNTVSRDPNAPQTSIPAAPKEPEPEQEVAKIEEEVRKEITPKVEPKPQEKPKQKPEAIAQKTEEKVDEPTEKFVPRPPATEKVNVVTTAPQNMREDKSAEAIREEIAILRIENKKLYEEARQARAQIDSVAVEAGTQALKKIREYEKKLEAAKADNIALSKEMEEMRRLKEDGRLNSVSGDWDLEQATKRFNEAEREIQRLGLLLEQQKTAHRAEKIELEKMLFDPAVTEAEQRKKLAALEEKLAATQSQLKNARQELETRETAEPTIQKVVVPDPVLEEENKRLAAERKRLNDQLLAAQAQLQLAQQAVLEKPKTEIVTKTDPKIIAEKKQLEQELIQARASLQAAQIALKNQPQQVVTAADPRVQQNNIKIEELNKKLEIQSKQLQAYKRQSDRDQAEILEFEKLKKQEEERQKQIALAKQKEQDALEALRVEREKEAARLEATRQQREVEERNRQIALQKQKEQAALDALKIQKEQEEARLAQLKAERERQEREVRLSEQRQSSQIAPSAGRQTTSRAPVSTEAAAAAAPRAPAPPQISYGKGELESLLNRSGLSLRNGVAQGADNSYRWSVGAVQGKAVVVPASQNGSISSFAQNYINQAKQACAGEFASLPAGSPNAYEIACIGQNANTSSSVVFVQQNNSFIAIDHKTTTDDMDLAMDARDRIANSL
ncbi:MAG: hypothetical protein AAF549_04735 [Pseudomonadota bacterium]